MSPKKKKPEPLPLRTSEHIKEDDSNDIFKAAIKPWMYQGATTREYGIDGVVEITKVASSLRDQTVTGKRFSVQLKSSDVIDFDKSKFSLSVKRDRVNYWYSSLEPVLIVLVDLNSKSCFFRWIDEDFIQELFKSNPNWIAQDSVSIKFEKGNVINIKNLLSIEKYVLSWKRPSKTILTPGSFFKFNNEAKSFIDLFLSKVKEYKISFLADEIKTLQESSAHSIYTIAIVGPNKAGKSTLINCFLQSNISPVGMLPTTGIPITIFPSSENKVIVQFKDNKEVKGKVEESFLREYTSKDSNPNNVKNVKIVSVQIVNSLLERGFSICDVPGLDDADEEIRKITKTALYNVNAIVYLVSAGPMASGDFSINKQIVDDLKELGSRMDRLFLVFNKIDLLNEERMIELKRYINETLTHHEILKYLPSEPIYISSQKSFVNRLENKNTKDTVGELETQVWQYLLSQNKTGLHKVIGSFADCTETIDRLRKVIKARMIDSEKREKLEEEIQQVRSEINDLRKLVAENREIIQAALQHYLENSLSNIIVYLENHLTSVPLTESLSTNEQITIWLEDNAFRVLSDLYSTFEQDIYVLQSKINQWISEKLKQVEIGIESPESNSSFQMPDISRYTNQISSNYYEKKTGYLGILESIFVGLFKFAENVINAIDEFITPNDKLRQKQIKEIIKKSRRSYNRLSSDSIVNLTKHLTKVCRFMEEKSIDRAKVYLGELSTQLTQLDQPVSLGERRNFENFLQAIEQIEIRIKSNLIHLQEYTDGVKWLDDEIK